LSDVEDRKPGVRKPATKLPNLQKKLQKQKSLGKRVKKK
jgi:hypothetical protein